MTALRARQLSVSIGPVQVCESLDLEIRPGERWCILGRNGAGKTTLLHTLCGLRRADQGDLLLNDNPLHALPRKTVAQSIGILLQDHGNPFPATVMESALVGRHPWLGALQWETDNDRARAAEIAARTVCGCQPNDFWICAMVAPDFRFSNLRSCSCRVSVCAVA